MKLTALSRVLTKSKFLLPGHTAFAHRANDRLLSLLLYPDPRGYQKFTFEFGWSFMNRYPEVLSVKCPAASPERKEFELLEYTQRIGTFLGHDHWWWLEPRDDARLHARNIPVDPVIAEQRVKDAVLDAIITFEKHLIPYFEEFLQSPNRHNNP